MSCLGLWLQIQARCGQKDPRKLSARDRAVIMAYLRSKSSAKRVKASVGSKTRSAKQLFIEISFSFHTTYGIMTSTIKYSIGGHHYEDYRYR